MVHKPTTNIITCSELPNGIRLSCEYKFLQNTQNNGFYADCTLGKRHFQTYKIINEQLKCVNPITNDSTDKKISDYQKNDPEYIKLQDYIKKHVLKQI